MTQFNQQLGEADYNMYAPDEYGYANGIIIKQGYALFIQEIQLLFDTERGEILGNDFGSEARRLIWRQRATEQQVTALLIAEIKRFCDLSNKYRFKLSVKFMLGDSRDIAVIDIEVEALEEAVEYGGIVAYQYTFS